MICHYRQFMLAARRSAAFLALVSVMLLVAGETAGQQPTWSDTGSLHTARTLHTATLLANGKVLVVGGFIPGNQATASAELYDPATGLWSATGSPSTPRLNHIAVRLQNGKVLIASGNPNAFITRLNTSEIYDPDTGTWSAAGNLSVARQTPRATLLADGRVLVSGGLAPVGGTVVTTDTAEVYDPATNVWTPTGLMNSARISHSVTLLPNGKVLAAGGTSSSNIIQQGTAELYDPASNAWTLTGELTTPRSSHASALLANGKVLLSGGLRDSENITANTELYDPATGQWSPTGSMTTPRFLHTLTLLPNGKALAAAGAAANVGALLNSSELFDPATGQWSATAALSVARLNHKATLLQDGKVMVVGGSGNSFPLVQTSSVELFDSGTPASTIQLSSASFSVSENAGRADITVTRTGDTSGVSSVDFATGNNNYVPCSVVNGVAVQNCDFILASGKLTFNASETIKAFSILITDDLYVEGNETLNITLSNPDGGALLVGQNAATLTIVDNDSTTPTTNPLDESQFFVRQHYYDFLSRLPDQGGLDYWTFQIASCGADARCVVNRRVGVSAAFFIELEFQQTGYVVYRLYRAAYGTLAGAPGRANLRYSDFMPDRSQLVAGPQLAQSTIDFTNRFVARLAFRQDYPDSMTSNAFVNKLFDTAGLTHQTEREAAIQALTDGSKTRAQVLLDLIEIQEFKAREYNPAFVLMQYFGYLRRDPDQGGYDFWLSILNNVEQNNFRGMVCAFITSREYQERFSPVVTVSDQICANID